MVSDTRKHPRRWVVVLVVLLSAGIGSAILYRWNGRNIEQAIELRRQDQLAEADRVLSQCLNLPGQRDAIALEWQLGGVQQGDLRDEGSLKEKAEMRSSDGWNILESLCKGNMAVFRWNEARGFAEEMLQWRPNDAGALWLRGRCWVNLQQEPRAMDDFRQAVKISPASWEYKLSFAELLQQQGYNAEAIELFRELVQERQYDARIMIGLSRSLHDAADIDEAKRVLNFLIELQAGSQTALIELSRIFLRQGDPVTAEEWARKAAAMAPRSQQVQFVLLLCLKALNKDDTDLTQRVREDDRIRVELKNLLRTSSTDSDALCRVGQFMLATGEVDEGIGCYYRAIIEDPKNKVAHEALADYFQRNGQKHRSLLHRLEIGADLNLGKPDLNQYVVSNQPEAATALSIDFQSSGSPIDGFEATQEQVHQLCAECHAYPPPDSFPKSAWRKEVQLGFDFLRDSKLSGKFPSIESVISYYENRAPDHLAATTTRTASTPLSFHFDVAGGGWLKNTPPFPATTHVSFVQLKPKRNLDLLVCDARVDQVLLLDTEKNPPQWSLVGPVVVPSHAEVVDLDVDGSKDIVVASLGQFFPTDDKVGSVVWLRATSNGSYSPVTLLKGFGRVADVRPADFNGDGLIDLVVAVFGWRKEGGIYFLENKTTDWREPVFEKHQLDDRHGASHVPLADLNKDGLPDFVALLSQEHEAVIAFLNEGNGRFRQEKIFLAPHPAYGSSGIELVDMDADNDLDVLLTNGDVLDRPYILKPYHGVQWLENTGGYPFKHHPIAAMHGASHAVAADFDGDKDMDVVAVSFLPAQEFPMREKLGVPSAMLFEQTSPGVFANHVLETASCDHFTCATADWDADGKVDFALGNFSWKRSLAIPDAALLLKNVAN